MMANCTTSIGTTEVLYLCDILQLFYVLRNKQMTGFASVYSTAKKITFYDHINNKNMNQPNILIT